MIKLLGKSYPIRKLLFFIGEGAFLFISILAVDLYLHLDGDPGRIEWNYLGKVFFSVSVCLLSLYYFNLYTFRYGVHTLDMLTRMAQALGCASIILGSLYYCVPPLLPGRWVFLSGLGVFCSVSLVWRLAYAYALHKGLWTMPVLMVGSGRFPFTILEALDENRDSGFRLTGLVLDEPNGKSVPPGLPVFCGYDNLYGRAVETRAECVIVAMDEMRGRLPLQELLECKVRGVQVIDGESFYEEMTGKILVEKINPSWLIFREGFSKPPLKMAMKRLVGVLCAAMGLVLTAPVLIATAILIPIDSPGPVFFRQTRVGKDGRNFTLVKFRSMRTDAEKDGARWASSDDDRVTRVGRFIRKARIDEIPQMWNVLRGDMSFVGPRPERPEFVARLGGKIPFYNQRHAVPPGITGWAQINYPYGASDEDALKKLEYDLYYVKHMTIFMDLYIILKTVKTILFREGSR